jgi:serine/threonine-protein kinase RsbW
VDGREGLITFTCDEYEGCVVVEIDDTGLSLPAETLDKADGSVFEFNPLDIGALPEGGMGLALIKASFDSVHYQSADGTNRLTLIRRFVAGGDVVAA